MFKSHLFPPNFHCKALTKRDYALWDGGVVLRATNDTTSASSLSPDRRGSWRQHQILPFLLLDGADKSRRASRGTLRPAPPP